MHPLTAPELVLVSLGGNGRGLVVDSGSVVSAVGTATGTERNLVIGALPVDTGTTDPTTGKEKYTAGVSGDGALPLPLGLPASGPIRLSAEHASLDLEAPSGTPAVGDKVSLVVGYSDTTIHLHSELFGIRNGQVERVFAVAARGKLR